MNFRRARFSLKHRLEAITAGLCGSMPATLYHYTSAAGLKGIVESGELWASNARYLNDSAEILLGIRHLRTILKAHKKNQNAPNEARLLDEVWQWIPLLENVSDRAYAVCFCETDDLLGQWRGYANMGGGYSIGFNPKGFDLARQPKLQPRLLKVIYDRGAQRAAIREILKEAYRWVAGLGAKPDQQKIADAAADVIIEAFGLLAAFKDPSFSAEEEWRLVYTPSIQWLSGNLEFIDYGAWLKPFVRCKPWNTGKPPIVSVTCGPSLNGQLSVAAVRLLLQRNGMLPMIIRPKVKLSIDVRRSKVPFRYSR